MKKKIVFIVLSAFFLSGILICEKRQIDKRFAKNGQPEIVKNKKQVMMGYPDKFSEMHKQIRTKGGAANPEYKDNYKLDEIRKAKELAKNKSKSSILNNYEFVSRGPSNISGRTRCLVVDPSDETNNTWYAGAASGGVWKTENAGESWVNLTAELPNLAVASLVIAPSDPNIIYAGTGESFAGTTGVSGDGIFVSFDKGSNWQQVSGTINFGCVNRLVVDPENDQIVEVAISNNKENSNYGYILKTTNRGNTWDTVFASTNGKAVEDLKMHPSNFNIQYATVNGTGVFKTRDAGQSWEPVLNLSGSGRSELALARSNPNVVYASVESNYSSLLYKSIDAGKSWMNIGNGELGSWLGSQGFYDNAIGINPYSENDVYLGGVFIYRVLNSNAGIVGVQQNDSDDFMQLLSWDGYQKRGIGTGASYSDYYALPEPQALELSDYTSVEIRFGEGLGQWAHRFVMNNDSLVFSTLVTVPFEVWDTENEKQLTVSFYDFNKNEAFDLLSGEDDSSEVIWINALEYTENEQDEIANYNGFVYKNIYTLMPVSQADITVDMNNLPESNITILFNQNGTASPVLDKLAGDYVPTNNGTHVDHHVIEMLPINESSATFRILNGNDGGVFYSDNRGESWTSCLNEYITTQFYGVDKHPDEDRYIGGMQDNGTYQTIPDPDEDEALEFRFCMGADGFETSWHYTNPDWIVASMQRNGLHKSLDGGKTWKNISSAISSQGFGPFFTKIAKTNSNPDLLFIPTDNGVLRSEDFARNWELIPIPDDQWRINSFVQTKISLADSRVVWAGAHLNNPVYPNATLHVSVDEGLTFQPINGVPQQSMGMLSGFATHPVDNNTAYAIFSFANAPKILRTTDLGESWEDISGFATSAESLNGFPDVATYSLLVMPHNPDIIWVGTEIGLFESTDGGASWHYAIDDFPAVSIWYMRITGKQVVIATHGRGIFSITIPELPDHPPMAITSPKIEGKGVHRLTNAFQLNVNLRARYDSTTIFINDERFKTLEANANPQMVLVSYPVNQKETITIRAAGYLDGLTYRSVETAVEVAPIKTPTKYYENDFDISNSDFIGIGFNQSTAAGLSNRAIHSSHPYQNGKTITYTLLRPIITGAYGSSISYYDIALVEPGETGEYYPEAGCFDYVIVEASANGVDWINVDKGYDARKNGTWLYYFNSGQQPSESMFKKRTFTTADLFNAGDTILFRFKLYTDAAVNGWGWVIDSLNIQSIDVGISETKRLNDFKLQNFPNPFSDRTIISYFLDEQQPVKIELFDKNGRLVEVLVDELKMSGENRQLWNATHVSEGVYFCKLSVGDCSETKKIILLK